MAELDLLSAEGYVEDVCGPLILRTAAIEPPMHPLGSEYAEPHWGIFGSARDLERGWLALFAVTDVDAALATLTNDEDLERTERLSILIGASWETVADSAREVNRAQETAVTMLPPQVYRSTAAELRAVREVIRVADPRLVATVIAMQWHWATDDGGGRGPRVA